MGKDSLRQVVITAGVIAVVDIGIRAFEFDGPDHVVACAVNSVRGVVEWSGQNCRIGYGRRRGSLGADFYERAAGSVLTVDVVADHVRIGRGIPREKYPCPAVSGGEP